MKTVSFAIWRIVRWPIALYLLVVLMLSALQRSLIYFPTREAEIAARTAALPVGQVHDIALPTSDGLTLHGWHVLPAGHSAQTADECDQRLRQCDWLVLYFSGNAANRRMRVDSCELLARRGCHLFLVDYRGYGDNQGSPSEEGLAEDARSIWNYAVKSRGVPAERVVLYGESLGGGVAVRLAASLCQSGTPPGGLILQSTFSSLVDIGAHYYPWLPVQWTLADRFESTKYAPQITCPLLQVHGDVDAIIPQAFGRRLFEAVPDRSRDGFPKRWVTLRGADHNDILMVAANQLRAAIAQFLDDVRQTDDAPQDDPR